MIVLDTHIWVWWVHGNARLTATQSDIMTANETDTIGVSAISCWEIAKLVEYGRLELPCTVKEWFDQALRYPGVRLLELTPEIAIESTQLQAKRGSNFANHQLSGRPHSRSWRKCANHRLKKLLDDL